MKWSLLKLKAFLIFISFFGFQFTYAQTGLRLNEKLFLLSPAMEQDTIQRPVWKQKLFHDHLIRFSDSTFEITVDPLVNFSYLSNVGGVDTGRYYINSRGFSLRGNLNRKLYFGSTFVENQAFYPGYQNDFIQQFGVVPGQGRVKPFKQTGVDYAYATGYVLVMPNENWTISFGNEKTFIGNGYRSLVLSDNTFNFPCISSSSFFLKDKIRYRYVYSWMSTLNRSPNFTTVEAPFIRKNFSLHQVDFFVLKEKLMISLFDASIWARTDSVKNLNVDPLSYQPILGLSLLNNTNQSNHLFGFGLVYNILKKRKVNVMSGFNVYVNSIKELSSIKLSFQAGAKYYLSYKDVRAMMTVELNRVPAFTYSTSQANFIGFSHYNQPLAHPLGSGFQELLASVYLSYKRFGLNLYYNKAYFETDASLNRQGFDITFAQHPVKTELNKDFYRAFYRISGSYTMNTSYNLQVFAGVFGRKYVEGQNLDQEKYVEIGIKTNLYNYYFDF